ncbi:hypothetical protein [Extibacter muris]|nr:hypothetical protein [Extibacter muris]MCU0080000.1 hypothetical protein [Extibacter muris]
MRPGTATITQILTSLPLRPSHLPHTYPSAIYFTGTCGSGCVILPAYGSA